jgi:hypothetical protein
MLGNVNITQIYQSLIELCDVNGFDASTLRKINDPNPTDLRLVFYPRNPISIPIEHVAITVDRFISGKVKQLKVYLDAEKNIVVYIEFMNSSYDDDSLYGISQKEI